MSRSSHAGSVSGDVRRDASVSSANGSGSGGAKQKLRPLQLQQMNQYQQQHQLGAEGDYEGSQVDGSSGSVHSSYLPFNSHSGVVPTPSHSSSSSLSHLHHRQQQQMPHSRSGSLQWSPVGNGVVGASSRWNKSYSHPPSIYRQVNPPAGGSSSSNPVQTAASASIAGGSSSSSSAVGASSSYAGSPAGTYHRVESPVPGFRPQVAMTSAPSDGRSSYHQLSSHEGEVERYSHYGSHHHHHHHQQQQYTDGAYADVSSVSLADARNHFEAESAAFQRGMEAALHMQQQQQMTSAHHHQLQGMNGHSPAGGASNGASRGRRLIRGGGAIGSGGSVTGSIAMPMQTTMTSQHGYHQ